MRFIFLTYLMIYSSFLCADASKQLGQNIIISDLNLLDEYHLAQQLKKIDELARIKLGAQVHGNIDDLDILQRIIHRGLIDRDDHLSQQALGVVLGNVLAKELELKWMVYEDSVGRSRALCEPDTDVCVFPITMLSRRMKVGLMPDVTKVYSEVKAQIKPFLSKKPFSD